MEVSFNELRQKEVVNVLTGSKMGRICDLIFTTSGKDVLGLVVPGERRLFKQADDVFVPWCNVNMIGDDVILVAIDVDNCKNIVRNHDKKDELRLADYGGDYLEK